MTGDMRLTPKGVIAAALSEEVQDYDRVADLVLKRLAEHMAANYAGDGHAALVLQGDRFTFETVGWNGE